VPAVENDNEIVLAATALDELSNAGVQRPLGILRRDHVWPYIVVESVVEHIPQFCRFLVETGAKIVLLPGNEEYIYSSVPLRS
jgi:hypothetical protein